MRGQADTTRAAATALRRAVPSLTGLRWLAAMLGLATAYFVAGRLAQLLASSPGNVMAVYPPAGIALAALLMGGLRLWPGVWLGSFAFNAWAFARAVGAPGVESGDVMLAAVMGLGAALQAAVGALLVRRFTGLPEALDHGLDILKLLVAGGPVSCVVGASIGVGALAVGGVVPVDQSALTWVTWWLGDTIGVLIVTPLVLVGSIQTRRRRARWLAGVALPVCIAFVVAVILFVLVRGWEEDRVQVAFERRVEAAGQTLRRSIDVHLEGLQAIKSFYMGSEHVSREEFRTFVRDSLAHRAGIQALEWIPRVPDAGRAAYEVEARREGLEAFRITERTADGAPVPTSRRAEYFPVFYAEPLEGNERAFGFDLASNPVRRRALERARDTGAPVASERIRLVQETGDQSGFLVLMPVYDENRPHGTVAERRASLRGYVGAVYRIADLVASSLTIDDRAGLELGLYDGLEAADGQLMHRSRDGVDVAAREVGNADRHSTARFAVRHVVEVAGRPWLLYAAPTEGFLAEHRTWQSWSVLAGALLATGLMEAFLLLVTGRTARIEQLVAQRTEELSRTASELRESRDAAEAASRAKSEFLARMSHELRTPLNAIMGYSYLLQEEARDVGQESFVADLVQIHASGQHLLALIDDVLDFSRIESGRMELHPETFDVPALVQDLTTTVAPLVGRNGNALDVRCEGDAWSMHGDKTRLRQILLNLLSNAAKFTRDGRFTLAAARETIDGRPWVRFSVSDTGIGIPPEKLERIFDEFTQVDAGTTRRYGGSGLGLAIARRFCEMMGGSIAVESEPGRGSVFTVCLPREAATEAV